MTDILYAYGTLRKGEGPTVTVKGTLYDVSGGVFPGIKLGGDDVVVCEKIPVVNWHMFDQYEGYDDRDPLRSLYIRRPHLDGFIYEYNREVFPRWRIPSGDWLLYKQQ